MKKYLIILGIITGTAHAQQKPQGFRIEGHVKGIGEKSLVTLTDGNKPSDTIARGIVKNGVFLLTGQLNEPNLVVMNFYQVKKKSSLFIGNESILINGDVDNLSSLHATGSSSESDFIVFQQTFNPYFTQLNQLSQLSNSSEAVSKRDSIGEAYQSVAMAIQTKVDSFIQQRKSSYVSPFLLVVVSQLSDDVFLLERRFNSLSPEVQQSMFGSYIRDQINNGKVGAVGSDAMDFTQTDTAGNPVTLSSFKGKFVLIDFWASWCKPCRMENPNILAAYERFKAKNFTVLGVSLDRSRDAWIKAIQDDRLIWSQVSDLKFWSNAVALQYHIQQIPQNFLIDPDGKIVGKNLRGGDLDSRLCALLGCN
ncbi:MAG: redoxin domain-containing protein [Bacteroidota bacterium]|nr:redoxin domain-containing protein [Bacteroidota bacterium]